MLLIYVFSFLSFYNYFFKIYLFFPEEAPAVGIEFIFAFIFLPTVNPFTFTSTNLSSLFSTEPTNKSKLKRSCIIILVNLCTSQTHEHDLLSFLQEGGLVLRKTLNASIIFPIFLFCLQLELHLKSISNTYVQSCYCREDSIQPSFCPSKTMAIHCGICCPILYIYNLESSMP